MQSTQPLARVDILETPGVLTCELIALCENPLAHAHRYTHPGSTIRIVLHTFTTVFTEEGVLGE